MHNKKRDKKINLKTVCYKDLNYELEYNIFNCKIKKMHPEIEIKRLQFIILKV